MEDGDEEIRGPRVFKARRKPSQGFVRESAKFRAQAVTQREDRGIERLKGVLRALILQWKCNSAADVLEMPEDLKVKIQVLLIKIHGAVFVERAISWRMNRIHMRFADFADDECWDRFRFRRASL
jgi:hypothetical protein